MFSCLWEWMRDVWRDLHDLKPMMVPEWRERFLKSTVIVNSKKNKIQVDKAS